MLRIMILALSLTATTAVAQDIVEPPAPAEVFTFVEQMPEAPFNVNEYLRKNIQYPDSAIKAGIEGRANVRFVVNKDGHISDVKPARYKHLGYGLDEEALRVIAAMPTWTPGRQNGRPVSVYYTMPVVFSIDDAINKKQ